MDFSTYQKAAHKTAVYPKSVGFTYTIYGLVSEVGELAGKLKKRLRGDAQSNFEEAIEKEIGDILWYLSEICTVLDIELDDIATNNIKKLADRAARGKIKGTGDNR